ncbi:hypothetical protein GE061_012375 [Apolygus lucorum]|uniref:Uncharacterized protein n=1 Tax=Apolygus lucorum TaxID=248454 RepID=A0A6A4JBG7_APOLU|nr:hypothetical protein GE061_012375 [Apolygus lucorum]
MDAFSRDVFNRYNENAETFQTGVLVRLNDDNFLFGNASNPLGLSCTEGYMRPVVLNVIRSEVEEDSNMFRTQVVMKNLTIFYKDCRVLEESEMFVSGTMKTPCFLTIDISSLIGWAIVRSRKTSNDTCENSVDMDMGDDITGAGTVRLFFLRSSTLYTFSLFLDFAWTKKIQEAVSRTSLILLSDFVGCVDMPETKGDAPSFEVTTVEDLESISINIYDDTNSTMVKEDKDYSGYFETYIDEDVKNAKKITSQGGVEKSSSLTTPTILVEDNLTTTPIKPAIETPTPKQNEAKKPEQKQPAATNSSRYQKGKVGKNYRDLMKNESLPHQI